MQVSSKTSTNSTAGLYGVKTEPISILTRKAGLRSRLLRRHQTSQTMLVPCKCSYATNDSVMRCQNDPDERWSFFFASLMQVSAQKTLLVKLPGISRKMSEPSGDT